MSSLGGWSKQFLSNACSKPPQVAGVKSPVVSVVEKAEGIPSGMAQGHQELFRRDRLEPFDAMLDGKLSEADVGAIYLRPQVSG
jgi:hypothetical protein